MIPIIWDMEIGNDPDDLFTLLLLLDHPEVDLRAVLVTPGTPDQVGLVRHFLHVFGRDLPVGEYNIEAEKGGVSEWYSEVYGRVSSSTDAEPAVDVLLRLSDDQTTLVTGGPLRTLGTAIRQSETGEALRIGRWVCQGGFAGEGVVPPDKQLPQFRGLVTNLSFNLNAHPKSSLAAITYPGITLKRFVAKNVCHGVIYDAALQEHVAGLRHRSQSLDLIWRGMDVFLQQFPDGKKFHDPLAACCAIDESIGEWAEVEIYREKGEWGARLAPGSNTVIIVDYDREKFIKTLTASAE
jgi:inosine-uridine nucleoside N-ribohydrolase